MLFLIAQVFVRRSVSRGAFANAWVTAFVCVEDGRSTMGVDFRADRDPGLGSSLSVH
jgi:hypothetical protein